MGAANWVSGGVRRAVSGVRSAMPGHVESEAQVDPAADLDAAQQSSPARAAAKKPADKPVGKKPSGEPVVEKAPAAKKAPAADKAPASKAPASKAPASKAPVKKKAPAEKKAPSATKAPSAANESGESAPAAPGPESSAAPVAPWTDVELAGFQEALVADISRLREELNMGEADLAEMLAHGDGAGDDQADAGSKTLEREQEMSVAANARELLDQSTHALKRLEAGTYGICESCASAIPAARLRAFPRATLCIACKQAEERG
jgi:RNA polymerase-binding protein DksA